MAALSKRSTGRGDQRRHRRSAVLWSACLYDGSRQIPCQVLNVSAGGVKIRTLQPLPEGAPVTVTIARCGSDFASTVAWHGERSSGLRFLGDAGEVANLIAVTLPGIAAAA